MKIRKPLFVLALMLMLCVIPMLVFGQDTQGIQPTIWMTIISAILTFVIGSFIPKNARGKVQIGKEVAETLAYVTYAIVKAKKEGSDGGSKITAKEWEVILATGFDGIKDTAKALGKDPEDLTLPKLP